jgi:hypothetical protein
MARTVMRTNRKNSTQMGGRGGCLLFFAINWAARQAASA